MVRLRNALMAVALATGAGGCSHPQTYAHWSIFHCSECDDFPTPAYGPENSMMSGTYSGPAPTQNAPSTSRPTTPASSNVPAPNNEAIEPPPNERPIDPSATTPAAESRPNSPANPATNPAATP